MSAKFDVDAETIRKLATILKDTDLTEIEVADGDKRLRVARQITVNAQAYAPAAAAAPAAPAPVAAAPVVVAAPSGDKVIASPMVGTAYLSPQPGAAPFIAVGDTVKEGQTLLIIEAMKVMNPIKASKGGKVAQILVSDAKPVEFGEVLIVLE